MSLGLPLPKEPYDKMFLGAASKLWLFGKIAGSKQTDSSVHGVFLLPPV
jgi:hypothetical protein